MSNQSTVKVAFASLTRSQLEDIIMEQAIFTEGLRQACNEALSHSGHIISNYAADIPDDKLEALSKAVVVANSILIHPAPVGPPRTQ